MSTLQLIIGREYSQRVAKKSFIITTLLMPLLMLGLMVAPALLMSLDNGDTAEVLVVDNSGFVADSLQSNSAVRFTDTDVAVDSALNIPDIDGILVIPAGVDSAAAPLQYYSNGPSSMDVESDIRSQVNKIIEKRRLRAYNIDNIDKILADVSCDVGLTTVRNDKEELENTSTELSFGIGIALTFVLYMFLLLYGQMVMTSIVEEKNNRVLELVVTSVRPFNIMLGKIIGVGLVAVTQVLIWVALLVAMILFVVPAIVPPEMMSDIAAVNAGNMTAVSNVDNLDMLRAAAAFCNVGYVVNIALVLLLFLIGGFLFYSAIFAAIGSAVDNVQDAGQLTWMVVMPIIFGLIFSMQAASNPTGQLAFWLSMIPFTSPMVMMARVPFGIPAWEIGVSLAVLFLSVLAMVWIAGKIYRVGIFMYGKKPDIRELIRWMRYK